MKKLVLIAQFLQLSIVAFSQGTVNHVVSSSDKVYSVVVTGRYHERFLGPQTVSLVDNARRDTLWTKTFEPRGFKTPIVSDNGIVIVPGRLVSAIDKAGRTKGVYVPQDGESLLNFGESATALHAFSPSGDRYFLFLFNEVSNQVSLLCCTDTLTEIWHRGLGSYAPCAIIFLKDKIIISDSCRFGLSYTNRTFIFQRDQGLVLEYPGKKAGFPVSMSIDTSAGIVTFEGGNRRQVVALDTLHAP